MTRSRITVEKEIESNLETVWEAWNTPDDIKRWNAASEDWHTVSSSVDLREGGKFSSRMEAKDGSAGFDFSGVYTKIIPKQRIEYQMDDGREVIIEFETFEGMVRITETFDADATYAIEQQREGWQNILENFGKHILSK